MRASRTNLGIRAGARPRPEDERLIERFAADAEFGEGHEVVIRAPADVVFAVAQDLDLTSIPGIYAIFWLRARILGGARPSREDLRGLVAQTKAMGWGELARRPGRELVMGAAVQPWLPEPVFKAVLPEDFVGYDEPEHVKIVWSLEAAPLGAELTRFRTDTRVLPTDESSRRRFRRYWRFAGLGIVLIRVLALPALRKQAERTARDLLDPAAPHGDRAEPLLQRLLPECEAPVIREKLVQDHLTQGTGGDAPQGRKIFVCRASGEERARPLPGDEIVPEPMAGWTHAISIDAPPEDVWPWLAQLGAGRGGWYSFDFLDNGGRPSAAAVLPRFQAIQPGDVLPAVPGATDAFIVSDVAPPRHLVLVGPGEGEKPIVSWAFVLEPLDAKRTRLIARVRASATWRDFARSATSADGPVFVNRLYRGLARLPVPMLVAVAGFGHGVMESRMLRGIARRASGPRKARPWRPPAIRRTPRG